MTVHEQQTLLKTLVRLTTKTELGANKASDACVYMTQTTMPIHGLADELNEKLYVMCDRCHDSVHLNVGSCG